MKKRLIGYGILIVVLLIGTGTFIGYTVSEISTAVATETKRDIMRGYGPLGNSLGLQMLHDLTPTEEREFFEFVLEQAYDPHGSYGAVPRADEAAFLAPYQKPFFERQLRRKLFSKN